MAEEYRISDVDLSDISVKYLIKDVLSRWLAILCAALIFAMGGFVYGNEKSKNAEYRSSMTLAVTVKGSVNNAYSNLKTTTSLALAMEEILKSDALKQLVCEELNTKELPGRITAEAVTGTNFITITTYSKTPRQAYMTVKSAYSNLLKVSDIIANDAIVEVLDDASLQTYEFSVGGGIKYALILGIAGFIIAVGISVVGSVFDKSIRSRKQLERLLNVKMFASVPEEKKRTGGLIGSKPSMLISDLTRSVQYIEAFKNIATAIEKDSEKSGSKIYMLTSTTANEGKSTVSSNVAIALAKKGHKVLLIDADIRKQDLYKIFGVTLSPESELSAFLLSKENRSCKLVKDKTTGVSLLLGSKTFKDGSALLASGKRKALIMNARSRYDYIIFDTSPIGLVPDAEEILLLADAAFIVVRENASSYLMINDAIRHISEFEAKLLGCIYNRELITNSSVYGLKSR